MMLTILIKAYCVNIVVDIKPIYLNKGYLFQNKIYYLDKIYLCFAKIKFSKHTLYRSSRPEVFCKKGVLRNFAKFTEKHRYQSFFFNKVGGLRPATLLKKRLWHRCFLWILRNFEEHLFLQNTSAGCFSLYKLNWLPD